MYKNLLFLLCLLLFGCQEHQNATGGERLPGKMVDMDEATTFEIEEDLELEPPQTGEPATPPDVEPGSKIIRSGYMEFEVANLETTKENVDTLIRKLKGYYEQEQFHTYGNRHTYTLQIRVPSKSFDALIVALEKGAGALQSKNISANDVTEEYVDLNIRLENKLAYLAQYQAILKKATSVKDILEVQDKIRYIEEEIESKKGRLKFLDDKVRYSSLQLELTQLVSGKLSNQPGFGLRLANAFRQGIQGFLSFLVGLVNFWPFVLLFAAVLIWRKRLFGWLRR